MRAPLREHRETAVLEHAQLADHAVAAALGAHAAGTGSQRPALDPNRIRQLERLDGRHQRVRHRNVDGGWTCRVGARALTAADRLVIRKAVVAESDVVHRPLSLCRHGERCAECAKNDVDDARRRLGIAGDDRGRRARVDEAARRRADAYRRERTARGRRADP